MDSEQKYAAPYPPFSTFEIALDKLGALPTLPPKIDHTVFTSMGGAAKSQVIGAFRYFGLIDDNGIPNPALKDLAKNKEGRKAAMRDLIERHYPNISANDLAGSSPAQIDAKLSDKGYNISGETRQKARSFLVKAAEFAELPVSPLLTAKGPRGPRARRPRNTTARQNNNNNNNNNGAQSQTVRQSVDPPSDPSVTRMPITLAPGRIVCIELPADWSAEKDAKKLLSLLALTFDVNAQVT